MRFEWDPNKNRQNVERRSFDFDEARAVFADPYRTERYDEKSEGSGEDRWITTGYVGSRYLTVVFTDCGDTIRIISAWKASRTERQQYDQNRRGT